MEERQGAVVRVLTLLEVLQARGREAGPVLASRLGVDQRTLRRDVARLQKLGIPVDGTGGTSCDLASDCPR
jgi:predicted DNA-binding transcriptional regulator YafY